WDGADPVKQHKSLGLRRRIAQRWAETQQSIDVEVRRRNELRSQHASQLVLELTPRRRKAQRQVAVAYERLCGAWQEVDAIDQAIRIAGGSVPQHAILAQLLAFIDPLVEDTVGEGKGVGSVARPPQAA